VASSVVAFSSASAASPAASAQHSVAEDVAAQEVAAGSMTAGTVATAAGGPAARGELTRSNRLTLSHSRNGLRRPLAHGQIRSGLLDSSIFVPQQRQQLTLATASATPATGRSPGQAAVPAGSPQRIALAMLGSYGWPASQFGCLNELWTKESGWNPRAANPYSGAFGIPQALPGSKMASAGQDWATNPATQIRWGLGYIRELYGSPCGAWSHELATGAY
jgi:hypothetical protein